MSGVKDEVQETVKDWRQVGDAWGHAVALWRVLSGRVKPSDRFGLTGDRRDPKRKTGRG